MTFSDRPAENRNVIKSAVADLHPIYTLIPVDYALTMIASRLSVLIVSENLVLLRLG